MPGPNGPIAKMKENIERPLVLRTTLLTAKEISLLPRFTLKNIFYTWDHFHLNEISAKIENYLRLASQKFPNSAIKLEIASRSSCAFTHAGAVTTGGGRILSTAPSRALITGESKNNCYKLNFKDFYTDLYYSF